MTIRSVSRDGQGSCRHLTVTVSDGGRDHVVHTTFEEIDAVELSREEVRRQTLQALKIERLEGKDIVTERRSQLSDGGIR